MIKLRRSTVCTAILLLLVAAVPFARPAAARNTNALVDQYIVVFDDSVADAAGLANTLAAQNGLCAFLFHLLQATTVTIISDYSFPAYLPPTPLASDAPPAILFLASYTSPSLTLLKEHLTPHSPPNLVHSLPAALLSVASLPTLIRPSAPPASSSTLRTRLSRSYGTAWSLWSAR